MKLQVCVGVFALTTGIVRQAPPPAAERIPAWQAVTLSDPRKEIEDLLFSADGRFLASVDRDGAIVLRHTATLEQSVRIEKTHRSIASLTFSQDGARLASWSRYEPRVKIWESATGRLLGDVGDDRRGHVVDQVLFSDDGRVLAVVTVHIEKLYPGFFIRKHATLRATLWDASTMKPLHAPLGPDGTITQVAFSHDGRTLAAWAGATLNVWDLTVTPIVATALPPHPGGINGVSFGKDDTTLTTVDGKQAITTWDVKTQMPRAQSAVAVSRGLSVVNFSSDGSLIALGGRDGSIAVWRTATLEAEGALLAGHPEAVVKTVFNEDHTVLAAASPGFVQFWNVAAQAVIGTCDLRSAPQSVKDGRLRPDDQWMIAMAPDGRQLAIARAGGAKIVVCRAP